MGPDEPGTSGDQVAHVSHLRSDRTWPGPRSTRTLGGLTYRTSGFHPLGTLGELPRLLEDFRRNRKDWRPTCFDLPGPRPLGRRPARTVGQPANARRLVPPVG